jgi:GNAT superfamily N-acetyltransferase
MPAYRFCRTDDVALLVDALNRCWSPYFPDEPPVTPASFKWSIRHLQVWCSSCMVAFSGADPIGVLIGAKRPAGTLIHRIAVHPDHLRQGHGRHLLTSLSSKLAILGPPRMIAEVPETLAPACELFGACGYVHESILTDYVLDGPALSERGNAAPVEGFVIPVTIDDLVANGLIGEVDPQTCWERSAETLTARKDDIAGLGVASDERIEAYVLYAKRGVDPPAFAPSHQRELRRDLAGALAEAGTEILSLRSFVEDDGARLKQLLSRLGMGTFRFPKVHPAEISGECLETLGFRGAAAHRVYAGKARAN